MLTPYQVIRSKKSQPTADSRKTFTPNHKQLSFSHQQRQMSQHRRRLKRIGNMDKSETEVRPKAVDFPTQQKFEVVVREGQKKRPTYRFTYTESHQATEEGKTGAEGNFRLVIEGGHCRKDLLKLNRRKLEEMIAKIRDGRAEPPGQPNNIAEVVLQKCQPRSRGFFMAQPRKSQDWKLKLENSSSPKQFDTRQYLVCHSVRQQAREAERVASGAGKRRVLQVSCKQQRQTGRSSYNGFSSKKYRSNQPKMACKTQQKLKNSSLSLVDHSSSTKRMQTTTSFNANRLMGWEPTQQRDSFFWEGGVFD